jgi:hypothetical protein
VQNVGYLGAGGVGVRYARRIDANQGEIVAFFRKAGAVVDIVSHVAGLGYDLVVSYAGSVVLVEVKDGAKPPSARRLTESEEAAQARHGSVFAVIESVEQAEGLLSSMAEHGRLRGD